MAASMNTFAVVLLAFPFYLAQKGRLAAYVDLAKPSHAQAGDGSVSKASGTQPAPATKGGSGNNFGLADLASLPALTEFLA